MIRKIRIMFKKIIRCLSVLVILLAVGIIAFYFFPEKELPQGTSIDSIVVCKSEKRLYAYADDKLIKTYKISLGKTPIGKKEYEGDNKTPEGIYFINDKNPNSGFHKNLGISYPNKADIETAKKIGKPTGGDVKIHGIKNGLGIFDKFHYWFSTRGCIRVTNKEIDELYNAIKIGTPIDIRR